MAGVLVSRPRPIGGHGEPPIVAGHLEDTITLGGGVCLDSLGGTVGAELARPLCVWLEVEHTLIGAYGLTTALALAETFGLGCLDTEHRNLLR